MLTANGPILYRVFPSPFGPLGLLWQEASGWPAIRQVFLSSDRTTARERIETAFGDAKPGSHPVILQLAEQMQAFLEGAPITFALASVSLERCSEFQRRVLVAEHGIPRGSVSSYGLIAAHLGVEKGARAVGTALARNPFPLIIPCHRVIGSDGSLHGFAGGLALKARLLALENHQMVMPF